MIRIKRVYEPAETGDGARFLVDRLWPRGIKKEDLQLDAWLKDVSPGNELRLWFGHDPAKWDEFTRRYVQELDRKHSAWEPILNALQQGEVTLLYAARDQEHNNALALKAYLDEQVLK
jgi:uncharacterized protein YeaO (DUF488 family)